MKIKLHKNPAYENPGWEIEVEGSETVYGVKLKVQEKEGFFCCMEFYMDDYRSISERNYFIV
jgi:hypothetical protein